MVSESQRKAAKKYQQEKTKSISVCLSVNTDKDILDHLSTIPNKAGYIKQLIRNDINK